MKTANAPAYVDVAPAVPLPPAQVQAYTYRAPGKKAPPIGTLVAIPFAHRQTEGIIVARHRGQPAHPVRPLIRITNLVLTAQQIELARFIAAAAHGGLGYTLRLFRPPHGKLHGFDTPRVLPAVTADSHPSAHSPASPVLLIDGRPARRRRAILQFAARHATAGQTLILVPEIWMTVAWEKAGACILHTKLPAARQATVWREVAAGRATIIVGTQKACFLPYRHLTLVVVDEEQLPAHKLWDQYPRLDSRLAARRLAVIHQARLLYAASYPSLSLRHLIRTGAPVLRYDPLVLRPAWLTYAPVNRRRRSLLPTPARQIINACRAGERVLIYTSRRAYLPRIQQEIGQPRAVVTVATSALFAAQPQLRFDRIFWVQPEDTILFPDFRSYERGRITLARLHQHLRRPRRVVIITRYPDPLRSILGSPEDAWTEAQLAERRILRLPPHTDLVRLTVTARSSAAAEQEGQQLRRLLEQRAVGHETIIRGPYTARAATGAARERHLLLHGDLDELLPLYVGLDHHLTAADVMPEHIV